MCVKLLQYKRCAIARDRQAVGWRVGCPKMIIVGVVCCAAPAGTGIPLRTWDKHRRAGYAHSLTLTLLPSLESYYWEGYNAHLVEICQRAR